MTVNKIFIPNSCDQLVAKMQADLNQSQAKLGADINSLFQRSTSAVPQRVQARVQAGGAALPKHRLGEFRDRLSAPLRILKG